MKKSRTDWDRLSRMTDEEIDYSDIPPLGEEFFKKGRLRIPKAESLISIPIDPDVLEWFVSQGREYKNIMSMALRRYMETRKESDCGTT